MHTNDMKLLIEFKKSLSEWRVTYIKGSTSFKAIATLAPILLTLHFAKTVEESQLLCNYTITLLLIIILLLTYYRKHFFYLTSIDIFAFLFLISVSIGCFYNQLDYRSLYPILIWSSYYMLIRIAIDNINIRTFLNGLFLIMLLVSFYSLLQQIGILPNDFRIQLNNTGFFIHTAPLAGYLAACIPLSLYVHRQLKSRYFKVINIIFFCINLMVIIITQSRAAFLAVLSVGVILSYFSFRTYLHRKRSLIVLLSLVPVGLYLLYMIRPVSALGRLFVWKVSLNMVTENPFTGTGTGQFKTKYIQHQAHYFINQGTCYEKLNAQVVLYPFNEFIRITLENGFIGILLFLCVLFICFKKLYLNHTQLNALIVITCLVSLTIFSFFSYAYEILPIGLLLTTFIALTSNLYGKKIVRCNVSGNILLVSLCLCSYFVVTDLINAKKWEEYIHSVKHTANLNKLRNIYSSFNNYGPFLYDFGAELVKQKELNEATIILAKSIQLSNYPNQYDFLAHCYENTNQLEKAKQVYLLRYYAEPSQLYYLHKLFKLAIKCKRPADAYHWAKQILDTKCIDASKQNAHIIEQSRKYIIYQNNKLKNL